MPGLLVLGTDTEVGKTYVACNILRQLVRSGIAPAAYKPIASGAGGIDESDAFQLWRASGGMGSIEQVGPQSYAAPVAPPIAAELEGRLVDIEAILQGAKDWNGKCDWLLVEGAGGLMSPITFDWTNADLARMLGKPIVLVTENRLGVVNQVLTALAAANSMELTVGCIVLNEPRRRHSGDLSSSSNERLLSLFIQRLPHKPLLTRLGYGAEEFCPGVEWNQIAGRV
ncbi:MAG: dethiobiotin synthase [Pirellula sp.]